MNQRRHLYNCALFDFEAELGFCRTTVPAQIKAIEEQLDLEKTIFIVSSKSGSTLEPNILKDYFFEKSVSRKENIRFD